jgi:peptidoglycan/xylan/chitin deacetylase (PgdA/CDA1 family)
MSRKFLRHVVFEILHQCGILWLWRWWHRFNVTILMIHGVMDAEVGASWVPLRPQLRRRRLDECLRILSRRYRFVSLDEAVAMIKGRVRVRPYSLVLTFDDGYRNQLNHAMPILRRWGAPAAIFPVTGHVESRNPLWFDRLDYALQQRPVDGRQVRLGAHVVELRSRGRANLTASYKDLRDMAKGVDRCDREMLRELNGIAESLEVESGCRLADIFETDAWTSLLSWEDLKRGVADDVTFGSHTVDHVRLALVDSATMEDQLRRSKRALEAHTGRPCRYLCYPSGSVTAEVAIVATRCGYEAALTTNAGLNRVGDDPMLLKRFNLPETGGVAETLAEVSGLADSVRGVLVRLFCRRAEE